MDDPRFKHLASDPRFKAIPKRSRKVTIDARFQSMFTDDAFKVKYKVDKRGRKVKETSSENLRKYYQLEEKEEEATVGKKAEKDDAKRRGVVERVSRKRRQVPDSASEESGSEGQQDWTDGDHSEADQSGHDSPSSSSSSSSSLSSDSEDEEELFQQGQSELVGAIEEWGEEVASVPLSEETSHRLAVCNMDWDHVGANDIFVLLNSFKPAGASVVCVTVYPSDFGLERMAKEDIEGPVSLSSPPRDYQSSVGSCDRPSDQSGEGDEYSKEKLRKYQLSRFKYYYAVVECDCRATAEHIYQQCNGLEYEHSGGQLDLRFIPDKMEFDDRDPTSTATEATARADFTPVDFVSSALQQSKVKLTWDETDPHRVKMTQRKFTKDDIQSMNFSAYLASSSSSSSCSEGEESGGEGNNKALRYKRLLGEEGESAEAPAEEMEITWEPGLKESVEKMVKKKKKSEGLTPWEQYLQEKKERRKAARQQRQQRGGKPADKVEGSEENSGSQGFDDPFFEHSVTTATTGTTKKKGRRKQELEGEKLKEKEELELLMLSDGEMEGGGKEHFNLSSIMRAEQSAAGKKGKGKRRKRKWEESQEVEGQGPTAEFKVDVEDPRFKALYESHLFAPDPSAPQYRATKGMADIMEERRRRLLKQNKQDPATGQTVSSDTSLTNLVNSVKVKAKSFKAKKRKLKLKTH